MRATLESSSKRESFDRFSSCQEFWNFENWKWEIEIIFCIVCESTFAFSCRIILFVSWYSGTLLCPSTSLVSKLSIRRSLFFSSLNMLELDADASITSDIRLTLIESFKNKTKSVKKKAKVCPFWSILLCQLENN